MAHNPRSNRGRGPPSRASPDDTYCAFRDDRERRNALVSRDLRIVVCRLATVAGLVTLALYTPAGRIVTGTFDRIDSRRMGAVLYRSGNKIGKVFGSDRFARVKQRSRVLVRLVGLASFVQRDADPEAGDQSLHLKTMGWPRVAVATSTCPRREPLSTYLWELFIKQAQS